MLAFFLMDILLLIFTISFICLLKIGPFTSLLPIIAFKISSSLWIS